MCSVVRAGREKAESTEVTKLEDLPNIFRLYRIECLWFVLIGLIEWCMQANQVTAQLHVYGAGIHSLEQVRIYEVSLAR